MVDFRCSGANCDLKGCVFSLVCMHVCPTYAKLGELRQANFEAIFASFDKGNKGGLTLQEMYQFTQATRLVRL